MSEEACYRVSLNDVFILAQNVSSSLPGTRPTAFRKALTMDASATWAVGGELWVDVEAVIARVQMHIVPYRMVCVPETISCRVVLYRGQYETQGARRSCGRYSPLHSQPQFLGRWAI
jgi:hypothetical protein